MKLIVCISGDGGGYLGPGGSYRLLCQLADPQEYHILAINTIPRSIQKNCLIVCNKIMKMANSYEKIFLVGWSLGTAVCVNIVYLLNHLKTPINIDSIIMISPILHHMEYFPKILIPIGFIHGKLDKIAPYHNSLILFEKTASFKNIHIFDECDHLFIENGKDLAIKIINMIITFDKRYAIID